MLAMLLQLQAFLGLGAAYTYWVASFTKPGTVRSLLLAPVIALYFVLPPLLVDASEFALLLQGLTCVLSCCGFKFIALCMGRGVLADPVPFWPFYGMLTLPIIPLTNAETGSVIQPYSAKELNMRSWNKLQNGLFKLGMFALLSFLGLKLYLVCKSGGCNLAVMELMYFISMCTLWMEVGGMGDLMDALALRCFRLDAHKHFDMPLMAGSLSDMWSHRWNMTISALFRSMVYEPILDGRFIRDTEAKGDQTHESSPQPSKTSPRTSCGSGTNSGTNQEATNSPTDSMQDRHQQAASETATAVTAATATATAPPKPGLSRSDSPNHYSHRQGSRKLLAGLATFTVSGLWHELVLYYMTGSWQYFGYWLAFFAVQSPALYVESVIKHKARALGIRLPRLVSAPLVIAILLASATLFWYPPMERSGLLDEIMRQAREGLDKFMGHVSAVQSWSSKAGLPSILDGQLKQVSLLAGALSPKWLQTLGNKLGLSKFSKSFGLAA